VTKETNTEGAFPSLSQLEKAAKMADQRYTQYKVDNPVEAAAYEETWNTFFDADVRGDGFTAQKALDGIAASGEIHNLRQAEIAAKRKVMARKQKEAGLHLSNNDFVWKGTDT
jgi:hypothetical protein